MNNWIVVKSIAFPNCLDFKSRDFALSIALLAKKESLPKLAQKILEPINNFLNKFSRVFVSLILLIFAAYLFYKVLK